MIVGTNPDRHIPDPRWSRTNSLPRGRAQCTMSKSSAYDEQGTASPARLPAPRAHSAQRCRCVRGATRRKDRNWLATRLQRALLSERDRQRFRSTYVQGDVMDDTGCVPVELVSRFLTASPGLGPTSPPPAPPADRTPPWRRLTAPITTVLTTRLARGQTEGLNNFMKWLEARIRARGPVSTIDFRRNEGDRLSAPLAIRLALDAQSPS